MKQAFIGFACLLFWLSALPVWAQSPETAAIKKALARTTADTSRVLLLADLSATYRYSHFDSVLIFAREGLQLAQSIGYSKGEGRCLARIGIILSERGNLPQALRTNLDALRLAEKSHDREGTARILNQTGLLYQALDDFRPALQYYFQSRAIYEKKHVGGYSQRISVLTNIGSTYVGTGQLDSAAYFLQQAYALTLQSQKQSYSCWGNPLPYVLREIGLLEAARRHPEKALSYYRRSAQAALPENDLRSLSRAYQYMAELYAEQQQVDSSVYYARKALMVGQALPFVIGIVRNSGLLSKAFQARQQTDSALKYMRIMVTAEDSLYNPQRIKRLDAIGFAEQRRLRQLEAERTQFEARTRLYALMAGLGVLILIVLLLWRSNYLQRQANSRLQKLHAQVTRQKEELTTQRDLLANMLQELKTTQNQLVLREKMASLGELMAGVAHEIQQPAKTIKDLAGVSVGLCQEMRVELPEGIYITAEQEMLDEMLLNLSQYQNKIAEHSQRVESIVRVMLEYSSNTPGPRQLTEINTLAHDYLRLSYHDLRAKNREFDAELLAQLDPAVGSVEAVRHDLGRALICLFSNALYAVQERLRLEPDGYTPQVQLSTRRTGSEVEIKVWDNGLGIPAADRANIFEEFFTTKPIGEGTGLGLSFCHDVITQGHGGTLRMQTQEGEYTEFIITLPISSSIAEEQMG
ncbi:ATP-binding protein [Hymenobacter sp. DG25B]|uniref:tetratricopeptide repeat-containing sensor histidine kinase n=1 Tax=Hymenobacter sp. DG25B TaxID=1385664 RepID=UPI00066264FE|nr:ATP-binding protein [Hymenobacter sp. DG25B]